VIPWQTDQADRSFDLSLTEENRRGLSKKHRWRSINEARLVSGEAFVADEGLRTRLAGDYQADLVDMNSFGLAAACRDHRIPLLVFRVISDRGDSKAGADFRKFTESYDGSGGALTGAFLENLPPSPDRPDSYDAIRELIDRGVAPSS
jgi:nucleoside phosphorylase